MSIFTTLKRIFTGAPTKDIELFILNELADGPWQEEAIVDACMKEGFKGFFESREFFAYRIHRDILSPRMHDKTLTLWYEGVPTRKPNSGGKGIGELGIKEANVNVMGFPYVLTEWAEAEKARKEPPPPTPPAVLGD